MKPTQEQVSEAWRVVGLKAPESAAILKAAINTPPPEEVAKAEENLRAALKVASRHGYSDCAADLARLRDGAARAKALEASGRAALTILGADMPTGGTGLSPTERKVLAAYDALLPAFGMVESTTTPAPAPLVEAVLRRHFPGITGDIVAKVAADLAAPDAAKGGEPVITHAALAAVVEEYAQECEGLAPNRAEGAREVLRRATGGQVPDVLPESRVVEVLRATRSTHLKVAADLKSERRGGVLPGEHRAMADACTQVATRLGLTLDAPPSGPGGGETCQHSETFWDASGPCGLCGADPEAPPERAPEVRDMERTDYKAPPAVDILSTPTAPSPDPALSTATNHGGEEGQPREAPVEPTPEVPPMTDAEAREAREKAGAPTSDVVFEADGVRVLADGRMEWSAMGEWLPYRPTPQAESLARALAEAKREKRKAAEDMVERCVALLRGVEMNGTTRANLIEAVRSLLP